MTFRSMANLFDCIVIKLTFIHLVFKDIISFLLKTFIEKAPVASDPATSAGNTEKIIFHPCPVPLSLTLCGGRCKV